MHKFYIVFSDVATNGRYPHHQLKVIVRANTSDLAPICLQILYELIFPWKEINEMKLKTILVVKAERFCQKGFGATPAQRLDDLQNGYSRFTHGIGSSILLYACVN